MRALRLLEDDFRKKIEKLLEECKQNDVVMIPFCTLRTDKQQARLWRQSRSWKEIKKAIEMLKQEGAFYLSDVLQEVGPQYGKKVTESLPGTSWHQFGHAIDCYSLRNEVANWDSDSFDYELYAKLAEGTYDLTAGFYWKSKDAVHIQKSKGKVLDGYTWKEVDNLMEKKFGGGR